MGLQYGAEDAILGHPAFRVRGLEVCSHIAPLLTIKMREEAAYYLGDSIACGSDR